MLGLAGSTEHANWPKGSPEDEWLWKEMGGRTPVGLFGACEVILHNGPVFVDETYQITREIVGKGETPRAEFSWTRTYLKDKSGKMIAEMTLQNMMLKGSF